MPKPYHRGQHRQQGHIAPCCRASISHVGVVAIRSIPGRDVSVLRCLVGHCSWGYTVHPEIAEAEAGGHSREHPDELLHEEVNR